MKLISRLLNSLFWLFRLLLGRLLQVFRSTWQFIHRRWFLAIPFYSMLAFFLLVACIILTAGDPEFQQQLPNKRINDITRLNPVQVAGIIRPTTTEEIITAIKNSEGPISIGGGKFSMGGQTAFTNSLHIDMRSFNKVISLDTLHKTIRVQPGISWRQLQEAIDPYNLSVKIMQTYANFTVGGSLSVNCHGRYIGHGPIISSVNEIKLLTADGRLLTANRTENTEIFNAAIGGYGGLGVLVEASLQLEENTKVRRSTNRLQAADYPDFFSRNIRNNDSIIFQNGDLYPPDYATVNNVSWKISDAPLSQSERLSPIKDSYWLERQVVSVVSWGSFGKWLRKNLVDPLYYTSDKVVWRNREASYPVEELEPISREESTFVLQEYFIPVGQFHAFIPKMKAVFEKHRVNVINVSIRHALPDTEAYLSWAQEEVFAFVIYYKQDKNAESQQAVATWTREMTDQILSVGGTWYLPYQPHASREQFFQGYPKASDYFALKAQLDPENRFTNQLLDKYNPQQQPSLQHVKDTITGYFRAEEQTILTIPEWYLVFNPEEYAAYLKSGQNPSDFPFYASIDEYWKLYDRSLQLVENGYPKNDEYLTMLQVIGISVSLEYTAKMLYENTLGQLFAWFAEDSMSAREATIVEAQQAYSQFIYHTAWYEFEFLPWIKQVWQNSAKNEGSFIRQWERTLFFTAEFSLKAAYAQLIGWAAQASYEAPVTDIYLTVSLSDALVAENLPTVRRVVADSARQIIAIPRWGTFTETIQQLSPSAMQIHDIGGNDEIAVSVIADRGHRLSAYDNELLYTSVLVSQPEKVRLLYFLPVKELLPFVEKSMRSGLILEHVYDY